MSVVFGAISCISQPWRDCIRDFRGQSIGEATQPGRSGVLGGFDESSRSALHFRSAIPLGVDLRPILQAIEAAQKRL